jgi:hypothetical protein
MSNAIDRTNKEMYSLFKDPKTMRQAWRHVGSAILGRPASSPIAQYDKEGNPIQEWESTASAARALKIDASSITKCLKGKLKTCGGFKWSYKN